MRNVLIIEDDYVFRDTLRKIVEEFEATPYVASTAEEAMRLAKERCMDLFLVDIRLEGDAQGETSGRQFIADIRQIPKYTRASVVVITGLAEPKLLYYQKLHCYRFIEKNGDLSQVRDVVEESLAMPRLKLKKKRYLMIPSQRVHLVKKISDIIYMQIEGRDIVIHSVDGTCRVENRSLESFLQEADVPEFVKCNRYTAVNVAYIQGIDRGAKTITLKDNYGELTVGARLKHNVREKYKEWLSDFI